MKNITDFIESVAIAREKNAKDIDGYDLFEIVKDNEKLLRKLCGAVIQTYEDMNHIKELLG